MIPSCLQLKVKEMECRTGKALLLLTWRPVLSAVNPIPNLLKQLVKKAKSLFLELYNEWSMGRERRLTLLRGPG
jgi:hypothetical protein